MNEQFLSLSGALEDFRKARRRANLERLMARLTGRSADLFSYQDVRQALRVENLGNRELKEIPIEAIKGSVDRYQDFTRSFLPLRDDLKSRWAGVKAAADQMTGWPPIEAYQVGDIYLVEDGNHRVSVAQQLGMQTIEAYVTEVKTKIPLTEDTRPDDLLCKALYAEFLEKTRLDETYPESNLEVTSAGAYQALEEHIGVHRYFMGLEQGREISLAEAAVDWYEQVYLPVVHVIRVRGMLREFPTRTETDLYLWVSEQRGELQESLGWEIDPEAAVEDLTSKHSSRPARILDRVSQKVVEALLPDEIIPGPEPGEWRRERLNEQALDQVFPDILFPVRDLKGEWENLDQALWIAQREGSRILGLHILSEGEDAGSPESQAIKESFEARCREAGIEGVLTFQPGPVARRVTDLSRFADLVLIAMRYPPGDTVLQRLTSGLRTLILHCPRPILAIPSLVGPLDKALVAYDGSLKSQEALYLSAALAQNWAIELVVLTVSRSKPQAAELLGQAREYYAGHKIEATYLHLTGDPAERILSAAEIHACDTIILGGYGTQPLVEVVLGSTADRVLQDASRPVFICQ